MYYICYMENEKKPFDLDSRIQQYHLDVAELMYELASDLLDQVADEDVLRLYKDNSDVFSKLSAKSKEEILQDKYLLNSAIITLKEYLEHKPLTKEEFDEMDLTEIIEYVRDLMERKEIDPFEVIQYLERL